MSDYIYDADGYVGDLASNNGLNELEKFLSDDEFLKTFFDEGSTEDIEALQKVLEDKESSDKDINDTIQNLKELVAKCKDIVIISDGVINE